MNTQKYVFHKIANGFYNLRADFRIFHLVNVETHMSLAQLSNGKYLLLDGVPVNPGVVAEIKRLTTDGQDLEAVVHTHPFHTGAIVDLHKAFPQVPIYGCPRHLKMFADLPWAGDLNEEAVRNKWAPDVEMRIPAGADFIDMPEHIHFSSVFVFHRESKTIHVDDTLMYLHEPNILTKLVYSEGMHLHPTAKRGGIRQTEEGPLQFLEWIKAVANDWDFVHGAFAHKAVKLDTAKSELLALIEREEPELRAMSQKYKASS